MAKDNAKLKSEVNTLNQKVLTLRPKPTEEEAAARRAKNEWHDRWGTTFGVPRPATSGAWEQHRPVRDLDGRRGRLDRGRGQRRPPLVSRAHEQARPPRVRLCLAVVGHQSAAARGVGREARRGRGGVVAAHRKGAAGGERPIQAARGAASRSPAWSRVVRRG